MDLSIIIPCFNIAKYLRKCLDSINQNELVNTEVIMINDGSTDNFWKVCCDYFGISKSCLQSNDVKFEFGMANWRIISQQNEGVSAARNSGLNIAEGDYILFIDPDDSVSPDLVSNIRRKVAERDYDIVLYGFSIEYISENSKSREMMPHLRRELNSNYEVITELLPNYLGYSIKHIKDWLSNGNLNPDKEWGAVWRVAYRRSLIRDNNILFNTKVVLNEDGIFNMECIVNANSVGIINKCLYSYVVRNTGTLKTHKSKGLAENKMVLLHAREEIISNQKVIESGIGLKDFAGSNVLSIIEMMFNCDSSEYEKIKQYILSDSVQKSIAMMPVGKNFKFSVIVLLLKYRMYNFLYVVIRILKRIGVSAQL